MSIERELLALELDNCQVVCTRVICMELDSECSIRVIGDPENAAYEWAVIQYPNIKKYSNVGFGDSTVALMQGLMWYHGETREDQ